MVAAWILSGRELRIDPCTVTVARDSITKLGKFLLFHAIPPRSLVSASTFTPRPRDVCIQTMCGMRHYGDQELAKVRPGFGVWENPGVITFWQWVAGPQTYRTRPTILELRDISSLADVRSSQSGDVLSTVRYLRTSRSDIREAAHQGESWLIRAYHPFKCR